MKNVRVHSRTIANLPFIRGSFRPTVVNVHELFLALCFGTTKMAAYENKIYVCFNIWNKTIELSAAFILCIRSFMKDNITSQRE